MTDDLISTRCWLILREDIQYSSERLLNIGIQSIAKPFLKSELQSVNPRDKWIEDGFKYSTYFMFNMNNMYRLETFLIDNGVIFKWLYSNKTPVGILIEPSRHNFRDDILNDCMTLEEYSANRLEEFNELKSERNYEKMNKLS